MPARILVLRGGALGDLILTVPAISLLRRSFPGAYIELAGYEKNASILLACGLVDRVRPLDSSGMAFYFQTAEALPRAEADYIRSFDLVISFLHDQSGEVIHNLRAAGAGKACAFSPIVKSGWAADHFLDAVRSVIGRRSAPAPAVSDRALLDWPRARVASARRSLASRFGAKRLVVIHPGSGSPAKNWPADRFAALSDLALQAGFQPIFMTGEADEKPLAEISRLRPAAPICEPRVLPEAADMLSVACGYAGNDSGITHLAAALGVPTAAVFGPTDPDTWAPRGAHVAVIRVGALADIGAETVWRVLENRMLVSKSESPV